MLRFFARRATVVLAHTDQDEAEVRSWGAPALLMPDDVPRVSDASARGPAENLRVVVAGSLDGNEPVEAVLAAARLMPEVETTLGGGDNSDLEFRPVEIHGEPLSTTILRERR